jgi:hypothetical protein
MKAVVEEFLAGRASAAELAVRHGLEASYLRKKVLDAGVPQYERVPKGRSKAGRNAEVVALVRAGQPIPEVIARFGLTRERVRQVCNNAGLSRDVQNKEGYKKLTLAVVEKHQAGRSINELAAEAGFNQTVILYGSKRRRAC